MEAGWQGGMPVEVCAHSYLVLAIRPQRETTIGRLIFFLSWSPGPLGKKQAPGCSFMASPSALAHGAW